MSSITKRHVPTSQLLGEYLTFVPTPQQVDEFRIDMRTLNPTLLRDAIREGVQVRALQTIPTHKQRLVIHRIYTRKMKEFSSIYPFVFGVENALRSVLADYLEETFGRMDWWALIRDGRLNGLDYTAFPSIRNVPVNAGFVKAVWRVFDNMKNPQHIASVTGANKSDEFYYCLTLGELWSIMQADWVFIRPMFASDADLGFAFTKTMFMDTMRIIKERATNSSTAIRSRIAGRSLRAANGSSTACSSTSAITTVTSAQQPVYACLQACCGHRGMSFLHDESAGILHIYDPSWRSRCASRPG